MTTRDPKFYKGEPSVAEIEHRLKNILAYIEEGNADKVKGCVKGVWHTLTQIAEALHNLLDIMDDDLVTLRLNLERYAEENFLDENEAQSAMEELLDTVDKMKPYLETAERYARSKKFSDDELRKVWGLMYEYLQEKTIEEFCWREDGLSEQEIERMVLEWFEWINSYPPMRTNMKFDGDGGILHIPIRNREQRNEFAANKERMLDFLKDYFKEPIKIEWDFQYK